MLEIEEVSIAYGAKTIVQHLSLPPLKPGRLTAIVGPNGAGKSTLLKAVAGITPYTGSILLNGEEIAGMQARMRASRIGFMPQMTPSRHGLTVLEATMNVLFLTAGNGQFHDRDEAAFIALKCLEEMGMSDLALQPLHSLSGGQRQMASLAQTLVFSPQVILLDEPTSALDLGHQIRVMSIAERLAKAGHIVIATLHDLSLAARHADEIIVLHNGKLAAHGRPEAVINPDLLKTVYGVEAKVISSPDGSLHIIAEREVPTPANSEIS